MSSSSSSQSYPAIDNIEITVSEIEYKYHPDVEEFIQIDNFNIVQYLFNIALLSDIECRKVVLAKNVLEIRAAIYEIMCTKDTQTVKTIVEVFRNRLHPVQNSKILLRIFSHLKWSDIARCMSVSPDWKEIFNSLLYAKRDEVNLEQFLLMHLCSKNGQIENKQCLTFHDNVELKASIFQGMLAINPGKDETMLDILQIGNNLRDVKEVSKEFCAEENQSDNLIAVALSNHTILSNIFKFISLTSIKNCRIVCRTWNSVSEPYLRKLSTIKFDSHFRPMDFINVSKYFSLPDLPFKSFKFGLNFSGKRLKTDEDTREELSKFLTQFGRNIRDLHLYQPHDIRSYLSHTSYLTELYLQGESRYQILGNPKQDMMVPWNALHSIKILCLTYAVIEVDSDLGLKRITPLKVHFQKVAFFVGGLYPEEVTLNDYIDFTKVKDINVTGGIFIQRQRFDLARDSFDAERISFSNIDLLKAEESSKSSVDHLYLLHYNCLRKILSMSVKQLFFHEGYSLSLDSLPSSLEKLALSRPHDFILSSNGDIEHIYLPRLNYLSCQMRDQYTVLRHFENCLNLTDLEIFGYFNTIADIRFLPPNIKRLSLKYHFCQPYLGPLSDEHFDLDLLILDFVQACHLKNLKFDYLRPKVLVLEVGGEYKEKALVDFIGRNKSMDKIYVKLQKPIQPSVFITSQLSSLVDKDSEYYEFSNEGGKSITSEEYFSIQRSLDMKTAMKGFWNADGEKLGNPYPGNYMNDSRAYDYDDWSD